VHCKSPLRSAFGSRRRMPSANRGANSRMSRSSKPEGLRRLFGPSVRAVPLSVSR
jgi:hypothetical protein